MNQRMPNPDCRDGKHGICDGHGWDMDADTAVRCPCDCHSIGPRNADGSYQWLGTHQPYVEYSADPEPYARAQWEADLP